MGGGTPRRVILEERKKGPQDLGPKGRGAERGGFRKRGIPDPKNGENCFRDEDPGL